MTSSHPHASSSEKSLPRPATAQADLGDHLRSTVPSGRARAHVALAEAVCVAFVFNTINRIADALGFTHRSDRGRR